MSLDDDLVDWMQKQPLEIKVFPLIRLDLALHIVPRIRYLGFITRGKKGPLATTVDLYAGESKRNLIHILTVNTPPGIQVQAASSTSGDDSTTSTGRRCALPTVASPARFNRHYARSPPGCTHL
jgi:hypothetical protein